MVQHPDDAQLRRITRYEAMLEALQKALADPETSAEALAALGETARALGEYYGGEEWKRDFADDEAGLLPRALKRGVLSEDGIYNALEAYREALAERRGAQGLIRWVRERFSVEPEYPWDDENFIFRHADNRKWFAVAMCVPYRKLGIDREGEAEIVDVKCGPLLMGSYRGRPGVLPGWHMNKEHWLTVLLDGTAEEDLLRELLEISWELTKSREKAKKTAPQE